MASAREKKPWRRNSYLLCFLGFLRNVPPLNAPSPSQNAVDGDFRKFTVFYGKYIDDEPTFMPSVFSFAANS